MRISDWSSDVCSSDLPETRWPDDPSGVVLLERHFHRLTPLVPLDADASGLMVLTQDGRIWRRLTEDGDQIEQEFIVEVSGEIAPYGLRNLNHGLRYNGRALPPCRSEEHTSDIQSLMRISYAVFC